MGGGTEGDRGPVPANFSAFNIMPMDGTWHRRGNGRGRGGDGPLTFWPKLLLKYFPSFLNTIFMQKTIHQDDGSTNLRRKIS